MYDEWMTDEQNVWKYYSCTSVNQTFVKHNRQKCDLFYNKKKLQNKLHYSF